MIKVELETGTVIHTEVGVQGLPGPAGIGVPDPSYEPDDRLLKTSGGTLVYTDGEPVSGQLSDLTDVNTAGAVNDNVLTYDAGLWVPKAVSGGGGVETFTALTDAPSSYAGEGQKVVRVNAGETGLEFVEAAAGGDSHVPDPALEADGRSLEVLTGALVYTTQASKVGHTHTLTDVTDAGTAAAAASTDFATAGQGALADSAVQPEGATVTVIYDAGWPAERPVAATVLAVGHTTAPAWLTADDVWFEDVS